MSLNCAEIDLILSELDLEGSFIQNVVQPSFDAIAFYAYKGGHSPGVSAPVSGIASDGAGERAPTGGGVSKTVLVSLAPGVCRIHETRRKVPRSDKPLRFMEFCRARIKGSRVAEAVQLGNDRIVRVTFDRGDERLFMFIRLWSGAANIVVTDEKLSILDVFYRRPKRGEVTGGVWETPKPRETAGSAGSPAKTFAARELPGEGSFNERIDRWYAEHAQTLSREALVEEARRRFDARHARLAAALDRLETKRESFLHADLYRRQGDLLTANLWAIKPGMDSVEVADYEHEGATVRIELDPKAKPQENAARYYQKYRKAVSGLVDLEDDIAGTKRTIETLKEELRTLEAEPNPLVIQKALRRQNTPRQQIEKRYPGLTFRKDGWIMLVGRTAAENDELLRRHVKGSDLWLHTRDWPGGYVFVKNRPGKTVPLEIMLDAGTLAVFYSKARKAGQADLYYTQVKHLRRAKNAPKGTVLPSNEKNLSVRLDDARLKALEAARDEE
jgi:predicted ribosome quality control (RQC) complex YloA/Tae2 family protein